MTKKAIVVSTDKKITVLELKKDECAGCSLACTKKSSPIEVSNPQNFQLKKGSLVLISAGKKVQAMQGIISLLFPVLFALAGYFLASPILSIFNKTAGDGAKALFVLIFLFTSASSVFFLSRKHSILGKAQIVEVL